MLHLQGVLLGVQCFPKNARCTLRRTALHYHLLNLLNSYLILEGNAMQFKLIKVEFGPRLKAMRLHKNMTQMQMAERLGLTRRATYANWESPTKVSALPDLHQMLMLCDILDTQPMYLLCGWLGEQEEQMHIDNYMQVYTRYRKDPEFYFIVTALARAKKKTLQATSRLIEAVYAEMNS